MPIFYQQDIDESTRLAIWKIEETEEIIRFLFSKINNKQCHLFFLCISHASKTCLQELNTLIKSENLLDDYFIKFIKSFFVKNCICLVVTFK